MPRGRHRRLSGRRFAKPPRRRSRSSAAAAAGSAAPAIEREAATSTDAGSRRERRRRAPSALPPWAPTPGTRKIDSGISSRSRPRWRGSVAPTTAPIPLSPDSPASRRRPLGDHPARRSCSGPSRRRAVEHVGGARVGGAHEGEEAAGAVAAAAAISGSSASPPSSGLTVAASAPSPSTSPHGVCDRAEQRLAVGRRADRHVAALAVGDHQQTRRRGPRRTTCSSAAQPGEPRRSKQASCGFTATHAAAVAAISARQSSATAAGRGLGRRRARPRVARLEPGGIRVEAEADLAAALATSAASRSAKGGLRPASRP